MNQTRLLAAFAGVSAVLLGAIGYLMQGESETPTATTRTGIPGKPLSQQAGQSSAMNVFTVGETAPAQAPSAASTRRMPLAARPSEARRESNTVANRMPATNRAEAAMMPAQEFREPLEAGHSTRRVSTPVSSNSYQAATVIATATTATAAKTQPVANSSSASSVEQEKISPDDKPKKTIPTPVRKPESEVADQTTAAEAVKHQHPPWPHGILTHEEELYRLQYGTEALVEAQRAAALGPQKP